VIGPPNGWRKTPASGSSIALPQSSFVFALNGNPEIARADAG
jgi:hypothetical protein